MATFGYFLYQEVLEGFKRCEDLKVFEKLDCYLIFFAHCLFLFIGLFSFVCMYFFAFLSYKDSNVGSSKLNQGVYNSKGEDQAKTNFNHL